MSVGGPWYLAHPYSGDPIGNAARARRWLAWLMAMEPDHAICAPWLAFDEVMAVDAGPEYHARCLRDDVAIVSKLNRIILCGGRVSAGMRAELDAVIAGGGVIVDLIDLGDEPPDVWGEATGPIAYGFDAARGPA